MKKDLLCSVFVLCLGLFLCSCSKNEKDDASLTGTWKVRTANKEKKQYAADVVWEAPSDLTIEVRGKKFTASQLSAFLTEMLSNGMNAALKDVTLTSDGKVQATYWDAENKAWKAADGYATYKDEGKGHMRLFFTDKAYSSVDGIDAKVMAQVKAALSGGIPLRYTVGSQHARIYFDTETIKSLRAYLPAILAMAGSNMPPEVLAGLQAGLVNFVDKSTKIELGLNLER